MEVVGEPKKRAAVRMEQCSESSMEWIYDPRTGHIEDGDGLCLDTPAGTMHQGKVHMWSCIRGNANQQWIYDEAKRQIRSRHGMCLDSPARTSKGGVAYMWGCSTQSPNQQWYIGGPLTTTTTTVSLVWIYHPGRNCYEGHGAELVGGREFLSGEYTLEGCKAECEAEPECEGVVMPRGEDGRGSCGLRASVRVIQCDPMTPYDLWQRARDAARWTTTLTTTRATESSATEYVTVWTPHLGIHCRPGAGAQLVKGRPGLRNVTLEECKRECEAEDTCEAVTVEHAEGGAQALERCWLQRSLALDRCSRSAAHDLYQRTTQLLQTTTTTVPPRQMQGVWVRHAHRNCWPGHGANLLPGRPTTPGLALSECKARCEAEPDCQAITVMHEDGSDEERPGNCRLRKNLEVSECVRDMAYDLWERVPLGVLRISWVRHERKMCGNGKGAEGLPGKSTLPGRYTLRHCKVQCQAEPRCEGVIFLHEAQMAKCRLRIDLVVEGCSANSRYDLWERVVEHVPGQSASDEVRDARRRRRRHVVQPHLFELPL